MISNIGAGVGARGIVGAVPVPVEYGGPVAFPTRSRVKPVVRMLGLPGGPSFGYRERAGEGIVSPAPPERIPRLWYPNVKTATNGRFQFSTVQTASGAWLPPVAVPYKGGEVRSVRNRNVLRPSASSSFIPSVFISRGRVT